MQVRLVDGFGGSRPLVLTEVSAKAPARPAPGRYAAPRRRRQLERVAPWVPLLVVPILLTGAAVVFGAYGASASSSQAAVLAVVVGLALGVVAAVGWLPASWVGVGGWIGLACAVGVNVMARAGTDQPRLRPALGMVAISLTLIVTGWLAGAWVRRGISPVDGVRDLARVFVEPSRDFAAAVLGAAMAIPLLGGYAPTVFDADSSWLVLLSRDVHDNGIGVLERNQEVLIPPYVMGPLLRHGGYEWALGFGLVCLFALVGLTAYLARRLTGRTCAAVAAAAALLTMSEITNRVGILPMYAACFFLGYGGAWLVHRAMQLGLRHGGWWRAVLGGVSLVAAVETHAIGQLFYLVPFVLVVLHLRRRTILPLLVTLASMLVAAVPRIVVNHAVGGFSNFRSNRADWVVSKGYLDLINENYFENLRTRSPIGYLTYLPEYLNRGIGERTVLLLLFPIVLAAVTATWRSRAFVVAAAGMYVAALVVAAPSVQPRYFTPLAVGTALLVGVGVARAWTGEANARLIGASLLGVLAFAAYVQVAARVEVRHRQVQNVENSYSERFASIVRDTGPVLGVRSQELLWTRPDVAAYVGRNMTEEDYVTYLTWPSDEAVKKVLDKYGIKWVSTVGSRFETAYVNAWLEPVYGKQAQHIAKVAASPMFCLAKTSRFNALYRYGPCQPGDPGP